MILKLSMDFCAANIRRTLVSAVLIAVCLLTVMFSVILLKGFDNSYKTTDKLLKYGIEKTAIVRQENINNLFAEELRTQPEIALYGTFDDNGMDFSPELTEIQLNNLSTDYSEYNLLDVCCIERDCIDLANFNISKGISPEELDFSQINGKKVEYLYLGAGFDEIPVGTTYERDYGIFIVAGILDDSQRWFDEQFINGVGMERVDYTIDCTYRVFCVNRGYPLTSDVWLCADESYTIEQAIDKMLKLAEKHNVEVYYTTLEDSYAFANKDLLVIKQICAPSIFVVIFSSILILICMQTLDVFYQLKDLGIMYSLGFSKGKIIKIIALKNTLISLISICISLPLASKIIKLWFTSTEIQSILASFLLKTAFPTALLIIIITILIMTITSTLILSRYSPVQMIGGQND